MFRVGRGKHFHQEVFYSVQQHYIKKKPWLKFTWNTKTTFCDRWKKFMFSTNVNFKKNVIFLLHQESSILECSYFDSVTHGRNSEIKQLWPVTDQVYVLFQSNDYWLSYGPWTLRFCQIFSCHHFLAHLAFRPYELLPSLFVHRPSSVRQHFTF